ncbi:MAG: zinc dependent phospholipase C family protein [Polyangiaceae bacterium]|nr:zinc dependent phospholipase C family protein [Polyangiaceae bacterium]
MAWSSKEKQADDTHRRLARLGAELLHENIGRYPKLREASETLQRHMDQLLDGGVTPDHTRDTPYYFGVDLFCKQHNWDCPVQQLFNDHFYDADTGQGLSLSTVWSFKRDVLLGPLGDVPPENAESQSRRFVGIALATWRDAEQARRAGNEAEAERSFADAAFQLGYASHYLADLFVPHHASNYPIRPLNYSHSQFEQLANENLDALLPNDEEREVPDYASTEKYSLPALVTKYAKSYSKLAKGYLDDCVHVTFRPMPESWRSAAQDMLRKNRDVLSLVYYRFLREAVSGPPSGAYAHLPVGQFNVEIAMGNGFTPKPRQSRPPEDVKLRVEFKDSSSSWHLDTQNFYRWYSFGTNAQSSYFLDWPAGLPDPSQVTAICISRGTRAKAELWEINGLDMYIHGIRIASQLAPQKLAAGSQVCVSVETGPKFDATGEAESSPTASQADEAESGGCSVGAAQRKPATAGLVLLALGLAVLVYGRKRRPRSRLRSSGEPERGSSHQILLISRL